MRTMWTWNSAPFCKFLTTPRIYDSDSANIFFNALSVFRCFIGFQVGFNYVRPRVAISHFTLILSKYTLMGNLWELEIKTKFTNLAVIFLWIHYMVDALAFLLVQGPLIRASQSFAKSCYTCLFFFKTFESIHGPETGHSWARQLVVYL